MAASTRKFSLLDAFVFVAATAAAFGIMRSLSDVGWIFCGFITVGKYGEDNSPWYSAPPVFEARSRIGPLKPRWLGPPMYWSRNLAYWSTPMLTTWTLATLSLGDWKWRRIARRPGSAAGLGMLLAVVASLTLWPHFLIRGANPGPPRIVGLNWSQWWPAIWTRLPRTAGFGVVVAWSVLALGGRWAPTPDWHDRLGRALGVSWIAIASSVVAAEYLLALFQH